MHAVDIAGIQVEATTGAAFVLLRERDEPHRVVPIVVGGPEATAIALALGDREPPRPLTFDLMASLVDELAGSVQRAEVTELRDGAFIAELTVAGVDDEHVIDSRPSDAIALAVRTGAPLFVSAEVIDEVGAVVTEEDEEARPAQLDEETIEAEVAQFRTLLDDVEPQDFADTPAGGGADADPGTDSDPPPQP